MITLGRLAGWVWRRAAIIFAVSALLVSWSPAGAWPDYDAGLTGFLAYAIRSVLIAPLGWIDRALGPFIVDDATRYRVGDVCALFLAQAVDRVRSYSWTRRLSTKPASSEPPNP